MRRKKISEYQLFINLEANSAKLLLGATILALLISNTSWQQYYQRFFDIRLFSHFNLQFLINEGLMTLFFLVVGLEIKYEMLKGSLNSVRKAALPGIGALGGMVLPALIYVCINAHNPTTLHGWAIPTATDIAFSLALLSLYNSRLPFGLKAFLTALAIFDDLAAIIIIAIFYTNHIAVIFLLSAFACIFLLFVLNKKHVTSLSIYLLLGFILWFVLLQSGVHPTLAGVITGFMVPLEDRNKKYSPLQALQHELHPWVALFILPLFAFANTGISFLHLNQQNLHASVILGILFGLFLGKQGGVFGATWLAVKLNLAALPTQVKWIELYAISIICGIGFTISIFIGTLAFIPYTDYFFDSVKVGVLCGSLLSALGGYLLLRKLFPA